VRLHLRATDKGSEKLKPRERERDNERKIKAKRRSKTEEEVEKSTRLNSAPPSSLY